MNQHWRYGVIYLRNVFIQTKDQSVIQRFYLIKLFIIYFVKRTPKYNGGLKDSSFCILLLLHSVSFVLYIYIIYIFAPYFFGWYLRLSFLIYVQSCPVTCGAPSLEVWISTLGFFSCFSFLPYFAFVFYIDRWQVAKSCGRPLWNRKCFRKLKYFRYFRCFSGSHLQVTNKYTLKFFIKMSSTICQFHPYQINTTYSKLSSKE